MSPLILPMPPASLSPNARVHHMRRWRESQEYKQLVMVLTRNYILKHSLATLKPPVVLEVAFRFGKRGVRDEDNLRARFAAGQNALVAAGLLEDDSHDKLKVNVAIHTGVRDELRDTVEVRW